MHFNKDTSIGFALSTTLNILRKNFNKELKKYALSSEQYAVMKLLEEYRRLTPTKISELLVRDKATITRIIKSVINKGYVKKKLINNKSYYAELTEDGNEILKTVDKIAVEYHKMIIDAVGENSVKNMLLTLEQIRKLF